MKIKRIIAYFLDLFIVSIISSILVMIPVFNYDIEGVEKETSELYNAILGSGTGSSDPDENQIIQYLYNIEEKSSTLTMITSFITFLYFGVFAFIYSGQTLGKKILKIKIVPVKGQNLNAGLFIIRTLIITNIIPNLISVIALNNLSINSWYNITNIVSQIQELIFIIILGFMIFRNDERGLHDIICQTKVIETSHKKD